MEYIEYKGVRWFKNKKGYYFTGRKAKRYSRSLHRQVWYDHNGEIPKGFDVHHRDHDRGNNHISNLELIERGKHSSMHRRKWMEEDPEGFKNWQSMGVAKAPEWHRSEEGRKWHSEHGKRMWKNKEFKSLTCEQCGDSYQTNTNSVTRFCSNACKSKHRKLSGIDDEVRECPVCLSEFTVNKYSKKRSCSRSCSRKLPL